MNILIITPDGEVGRRVMAELLSPEFTVRVITGDAAALPEAWHGQAEIIAGPVEDAGPLLRTLMNVESVLWCVPSGTAELAPGQRERFARILCRAMQKSGTPRLVTISTAGGGFTRNAGVGSGPQAVEAILNESGAAVRHLRCGFLMEHLLSQSQSIVEEGTFSFPMPGDITVPLVAADDVADVALRWLVREDWDGNESLLVSGPERVSFNQAAAVLEQVLERPVRYEETPMNRCFQSLPASGAQAADACGFFNGNGQKRERLAAAGASTTLATWVGKELLPLMNPAVVLCE